MPELPEVETIRRQLSSRIVGDSIISIEVREARSFAGNPQDLIGKTVTSITRIGKYLFIHTNVLMGIAGHLKMTGRLILSPPANPDYLSAKHTRVVITLQSGTTLYFWDTRKFGYLHIVADSRVAEENKKLHMGPDPWEMDNKQWLGILKKSHRNVKTLLLDQTKLSGVGNIYANDALWLARVDPRRQADSMSRTEGENILASLRLVMERGLATGGASDNSYVNAFGERGTYQNEFLVYGRTGKDCRRDGKPLHRAVIGGRGTWYCPLCQK